MECQLNLLPGCRSLTVHSSTSGTHLLTALTAFLQVFMHITSSEESVFGATEYNEENVREYCQLETFSPRCRQGEVIVVTSARFGRMRVGKCIDMGSHSTVHRADPHSLGCFADVLGYVDRQCSGRQSCDIEVPNHDLLATRPNCFQQLTMYLEAGYTCAPVVEEDRSCTVSIPTGVRLAIRPPLLTPPSTDVSSSVSESSIVHQTAARCGSMSRPWVVMAQIGQLINIRLVDFTQQRHRRSNNILGGNDVIGSQSQIVVDVDRLTSMDDRRSCFVPYGYVVDKAVSNRTTTICGGHERDKFVYLSHGSSVNIVLSSRLLQSSPHESFAYLISFEAVGCSNLVPPPGAWLQRIDNVATVGCFLARKRWRLQCIDGQWHGIVGSCREDNPGVVLAHGNHVSDKEAAVIVVITIIGISCSLAIVFMGLKCIRRYQEEIEEASDL